MTPILTTIRETLIMPRMSLIYELGSRNDCPQSGGRLNNMEFPIRNGREIHLVINEVTAAPSLAQPEDPRIRPRAERDDLPLPALGGGQEGPDQPVEGRRARVRPCLWPQHCASALRDLAPGCPGGGELTSVDDGQAPDGGAQGGRVREEARVGVRQVAQVDGAHARHGGVGVGALDRGVVAGRRSWW